MTQIAIVGMDGRFPRAPDLDALWQLLLAGGDGIGEVPADRWPVADFYDPAGGPGRSNTRNAGLLSDADAFDHEFFAIAPSEAAAMDPQQRLLLQTAWRALEDATLDPRSVAGSNTGVYVGLMASEWSSVHLIDFPRITAQHGAGAGYFMNANRLSYHLDLKGPSVAVDTACSSSLVAVHQACAALRAGACDQALAGGVNLVLTPALNIFYTQAGLSAPDGRCKPFSARADGIGRGEGVAVLVLRRLADAVDAGLPIYAVIEGGAVNSDGRSNGITAPNRWAQKQVLTSAYRDAGVAPEQIDFVEAHGTGTVLGDMIEAKALGDVHGRRSGREVPCAIGSIKGNLGHTEGAAGIAGLIKAALSLHHGVLPPSRFADEPNPQLRLADHGLRLADAPTTLPGGVVRAGVSSFGIGGTNAHVVLASAPATADAGDTAPARAAERAPGRRHHPERGAQPAPAGVGEREHGGAGVRAVGRLPRDRRRLAGLDRDHRHVEIRIDPGHPPVPDLAAGERDRDIVAAQHVRDGEHLPGRDHHARSMAPATPEPHHARADLLRGLAHGRLQRVQYLGHRLLQVTCNLQVTVSDRLRGGPCSIFVAIRRKSDTMSDSGRIPTLPRHAADPLL
jgi:acyl transferase domain-containing protein